MEIIYEAKVRCGFRASYYEKKFQDFKASKIHVSEFPVGSKRNYGREARLYWSHATEEQARKFTGEVFYKNASFYGGGMFYIKDRIN